MEYDEATIQGFKTNGLGVIRLFGLDEEKSLALGFFSILLFSIFMLLTAPKPNMRPRTPPAKDAKDAKDAKSAKDADKKKKVG